jgi:Lon protease-like protein
LNNGLSFRADRIPSNAATPRVKNIAHQSLHLPAHAPLMVLPNALLFPHSLLPLRIFEERYREMLAWCLEKHRMFCVALMKRGVIEASSPADFHDVVGLGLVRACIAREDGTSNLVLQGLARVKLIGFLQKEPFYIAQLRELQSTPPEQHEIEPLSGKLLTLCETLHAVGTPVPEGFEDQISKIDDPEVLSDVVAHTFLRDAFRRQDVLEELRVGERMRLLIRHLSAEML